MEQNWMNGKNCAFLGKYLRSSKMFHGSDFMRHGVVLMPTNFMFVSLMKLSRNIFAFYETRHGGGSLKSEWNYSIWPPLHLYCAECERFVHFSSCWCVTSFACVISSASFSVTACVFGVCSTVYREFNYRRLMETNTHAHADAYLTYVLN